MKLLIGIMLFAFTATTDFFSLPVKKNDGSMLNLEQYRGKKILLVNIASGSKYNKQLESLQSLQDLYRDSLVVIGFPSNSFGNEPLDDAAIAGYVQGKGCNFIIAAKSNVSVDSTQHPVFQWLASKERNGRMGMPVNEDYKKYLVDKKGMVSGIFMSPLDPMDSLIQRAILAPTR